MIKNNKVKEQHTFHAQDVDKRYHPLFKVFFCEDSKFGELEKILKIYNYENINSNKSRKNCKTFYKKHLYRNESIYIELKL